MEIFGVTIMEWQTITVIASFITIVAFFGNIAMSVKTIKRDLRLQEKYLGVIKRDLKLREYENRAMVNVMFDENGKKGKYDAEVVRLMKEDSFKHTGRM